MARQQYKARRSARSARRAKRSLSIWGMKHKGANNYSGKSF